MSTVEERLARLERAGDEMERQLLCLAARSEIADLMGRYALYWSAGCGDRILEELWSHGEDITLEYGSSGVYREFWPIETFYLNEEIPGRFQTVTSSSPSICVRPEQDRAKGSWMAFGTETDAGELGPAPVPEDDMRGALLSSVTEEGKRYRAEILAQRYSVEFRREEGLWKIVHLHVSEYFRCPYDRDWVRYAKERFATDGIWLEHLFTSPKPLPADAHGENLPREATTYHWQYTTDAGLDGLRAPIEKEEE